MTSIASRIALVAGVAMMASGAPAAAANKYECMTDEGHAHKRSCSEHPGRRVTDDCYTGDTNGGKRSCSGSQKVENPGWRAKDECYTEDGRKRQCTYPYKAKRQK